MHENANITSMQTDSHRGNTALLKFEMDTISADIRDEFERMAISIFNLPRTVIFSPYQSPYQFKIIIFLLTGKFAIMSNAESAAFGRTADRHYSDVVSPFESKLFNSVWKADHYNVN